MKINKYTILTTAFLIVSSLNAAWSSATSADWETTKTSIASGDTTGDAVNPSDILSDIDSYIIEEGAFKTQLQAEQITNSDNLSDNQNSIDTANIALLDAQTAATARSPR